MEKRNITERTFKFAVDIVHLASAVNGTNTVRQVLLKQIVRSGTSIGANIEEGQAAESKADFRHKYGIALKETRETRYWLALLDATNMAPKEKIAELRKEADELSRIIGKIIVNSKKTNK